MQRARSSPAAQQNIQANDEVDERDQPRCDVFGVVRGVQNHLDIERHTVAHQAVCGVLHNAGAEHLLHGSGIGWRWCAVDGDQLGFGNLGVTLILTGQGAAIGQEVRIIRPGRRI